MDWKVAFLRTMIMVTGAFCLIFIFLLVVVLAIVALVVSWVGLLTFTITRVVALPMARLLGSSNRRLMSKSAELEQTLFEAEQAMDKMWEDFEKTFRSFFSKSYERR